MKDLDPPDDSHTTTLRELAARIDALGGNEDTPIVIEADGEPVSIYLERNER